MPLFNFLVATLKIEKETKEIIFNTVFHLASYCHLNSIEMLTDYFKLFFILKVFKIHCVLSTYSTF